MVDGTVWGLGLELEVRGRLRFLDTNLTKRTYAILLAKFKHRYAYTKVSIDMLTL